MNEMKTKLALLHCKDVHQTHWTRVKSDEVGFRVSYLEEGEQVFVEYKLRGSENIRQLELNNGLTLHDLSDWQSYRINKVFAKGSPTNVEMILRDN